ncbi:hypothetical protein JHW43_002600 [Diplocarpon mali]|nr:hypothetical protein JHW43_002600 [Diplocarpon mali]
MPPRWLVRFLSELGLVSLWSSTLDTKLLCLQQFVRLFAFGSSTLILVSHLLVLEVPKYRIGLFMTLAIIGDIILSFILTIFADALGRRTVLLIGATLMTTSGLVFAFADDYWIMLIAAIVGVISPGSGNDIGPFRAIEESTIAHVTSEERRGDIYAWYSLIGTAGTAFGIGVCGWVVDVMVKDLLWESIRAYRTIFFLYSGLGVLIICLILCLSKEWEAEAVQIDDNSVESSGKTYRISALSILPSFSRDSKLVVLKICLLWALESFGSNFTPLSWIIFFFENKFDIPEIEIGSLFFATTIVPAISMMFASRNMLSLQAMVFTHLLSAVFLSLIPAPSTKPAAIVLLVLRSCTQSMDTPPRSAFLAEIVQPLERTATIEFVNMARSFGSAFSPLITGFLAEKGKLWVAFVCAGALLVTYDVGVLAVFGRHQIAAAVEDSDEEAAVGPKLPIIIVDEYQEKDEENRASENDLASVDPGEAEPKGVGEV